MATSGPPGPQTVGEAVPSPALEMNCKLLIVGDSHCRELEDVIAKSYPNVKTCVIWLGQQTDNIMLAYTKELNRITDFQPDFILLHTGHNEIAYHKYKNVTPKDSTQTTSITISAALLLKSNHPKATIIISSIFPRLLTFKSSLRQLDLSHYNRTAERHGRRLHTEAKKVGITVFKNNFMWRSKSDVLVKSHLFLLDGLHLNDEAKEYVTTRWLNQIYNTYVNNEG